jgi:hypothetical protein
MQIRGGLSKPGLLPDLVVSQIVFEKVKSETDALSKTYWIFNVLLKVKNQGAGPAAASQLLLERNSGPGGAFQNACQTCTIDVPALGAGAETSLPPRQFNNATGAPSTFRATADSGRAIAESDESNNSATATFLDLRSPTGPTIPPGGHPALACDLTILSLDFQNLTSTTAGGVTTWTFDLVAVIKNLGPGNSPGCDMVFQKASVDDPHGSVPVTFKPVPGLALDATATISTHVTWKSNQTKMIYDAAVDCYGKVAETDEHNNQIYKTQTFGDPERPVSRPVF